MKNQIIIGAPNILPTMIQPSFKPEQVLTEAAKAYHKVPFYCLLIEIKYYFDYVLYGGISMAYTVKAQVNEILQNILPPNAQTENLGAGRILVLLQGQTPSLNNDSSPIIKCISQIEENTKEISLPAGLPQYLNPPHLEFIKASAPPLPHQYLLQSVILRAQEKHCPLQKIPFRLPQNEAQLLNLLQTNSYSQWLFTKRVVQLADTLAKALNFPPAKAKSLHKAALWQDLGMLELPLTIFLNPLPLRLEEYELIKKHVATSCHFAKAAGLPEDIIQLIALHHERVDGTGYPQGLRGEALNESAQLLHIINNYINLQIDYPWQRAIRRTSALKTIQKFADCKYDAKILAEFINVINTIEN